MQLRELRVQGYNTCKMAQSQTISVDVDRFQRHEDLDEERYGLTVKRLSAIEAAQNYVQGWIAALGALVLFVAPVVNHFVNAWLSSGSPGKP